MAAWRFKCYDDGKSPCIWQRWYDDNPLYRGKHDSVINMLQQQKIWTGPHYKKLKNNEVAEILLKRNELQHRIFGFISAHQEFTILIFGSHKDKQYTPKDVINTAAKRRKEVLLNKAKAKDCDKPELS